MSFDCSALSVRQLIHVLGLWKRAGFIQVSRLKATLAISPSRCRVPSSARCWHSLSARRDGATVRASGPLAERARCKWRNCSFLHSSALASSLQKNLVLQSTIEAAALLNCKSTSCEYYRKFGVRCVAIQCRSWCDRPTTLHFHPRVFQCLRRPVSESHLIMPASSLHKQSLHLVKRDRWKVATDSLYDSRWDSASSSGLQRLGCCQGFPGDDHVNRTVL